MILQEILINALFAYKLAIRSSGRASTGDMFPPLGLLAQT